MESVGKMDDRRGLSVVLIMPVWLPDLWAWVRTETIRTGALIAYTIQS